MIETEQEKKHQVELGEIVTETAPAFVLPTGETVTLFPYLRWLGNTLYELKKTIGGK